jgi:hypothetical protein
MSKTSKAASGGGQVVIQVDQRLFYGIIAVIGIVAIFFVGPCWAASPPHPHSHRWLSSPSSRFP